jgi:hypothetical protein
MNAHERLFAAQQATREGRHEEALRELVWFHHHALEEDRALYGVRLSYALRAWLELGKAYPPARQALMDLREQKAQTLLQGDGDRALFHDVESIDERLEQVRATYELYLALAERHPVLAAQCVSLALPAIVAVKDYRLAHELRTDPEARLRRAAAELRPDLQRTKHRCYIEAPYRWATIKGYAEAVRRDAEITAGIGQHAEARRLTALAADLIHDPSLRAAVRAEIAKPSRGPDLNKTAWRRAMRRAARRPQANGDGGRT